jgi:hypothetical protein
MSRALQLIGFTVIGAVCVLPIEARAAMNECKQSHAGEAAEDKSELLAKKRALESWVSRASRYGDRFARWGIAWNRQLDCARSDTGLFRCKAVGHPCAVRQVPPSDFIPLKRGTSGQLGSADRLREHPGTRHD